MDLKYLSILDIIPNLFEFEYEILQNIIIIQRGTNYLLTNSQSKEVLNNNELIKTIHTMELSIDNMAKSLSKINKLIIKNSMKYYKDIIDELTKEEEEELKEKEKQKSKA